MLLLRSMRGMNYPAPFLFILIFSASPRPNPIEGLSYQAAHDIAVRQILGQVKLLGTQTHQAPRKVPITAQTAVNPICRH